MQSAYRDSQWQSVRVQFLDRAAASDLVVRMQRWKGHDVSHLQVSVVYSHKLSVGQYVATLEFSADPRAVPYFRIYRFKVVGNRARIVAVDDGVGGASYQQADWQVTRTAHFIVYHSPYQLVGTDRHYLADLEHQRSLFLQRFRVPLPTLAAFYLYPDQQLMSRFTHGQCGAQPGEVGCASPLSDPPTIQSEIQAAYHEPIHVYELSLVPPPTGRLVYVAPLFIAEGTAVALEDRQLDPRLSDYCSDINYAPLDDCARAGIGDVDPLKLLPDAGFNHADAGDAYALGGSFVKYLILRFGYYRFGRFYYTLAAQPRDRVLDYDVAARKVFRLGITSLIAQWKSALCRPGC